LWRAELENSEIAICRPTGINNNLPFRVSFVVSGRLLPKMARVTQALALLLLLLATFRTGTSGDDCGDVRKAATLANKLLAQLDFTRGPIWPFSNF